MEVTSAKHLYTFQKKKITKNCAHLTLITKELQYWLNIYIYIYYERIVLNLLCRFFFLKKKNLLCRFNY